MGKLKVILLVLLVIGVLATAGYLYLDDENPSTASSGPIDSDWVPVYVDQETGSFVNITYSYADLVGRISPAVVSIITEQIEYDFFRQPYPTHGAGTGIVIDPQGYIVTNNHVVEDAQKVTVIFDDGESAEALKWVGDSDTDLAVIELNMDDVDIDELPYAHFLKNSTDILRIGDKVMAVGNAGGRGIASTEGTISFLGEAIEIDDVVLYDLIRTSAAINPGNSGGPLVNLAGQVVGINVAINPEYENFGYAISTNTAINTIEDLITKGDVSPAWLGVLIANTDDITPDLKSEYNISVETGAVIVEEPVSEGPADLAGLRAGDVIIKFGNEAISNKEGLLNVIRSYEPGDTVTITYLRSNVEKTTEATLTQKPPS